jgi:hypothetical protein
MMEAIVYAAGAVTTLVCAILLLQAYGRVRRRLLLWSGLCFAALTFSNSLVFVDLIILPEVDIYVYRLFTAVIAMALLLYGLIWEAQ